jgi:hypothetical protein
LRHVRLNLEGRRASALYVLNLYTGAASGILEDTGMKAVLKSRNGVGGKAEDINMTESIIELEEEWLQWKKAKAKGLVKGEFSHAEELLKRRKMEAKSALHNIPLHLGADEESRRWPHRTKGRQSKRK